MTKQNEQEALGTAMNKTEMFFEKNSKSMINALLAYLVKVNIVARWTRLDDKQGREMLHRLMTSLDGKDLINKQ